MQIRGIRSLSSAFGQPLYQSVGRGHRHFEALRIGTDQREDHTHVCTCRFTILSFVGDGLLGEVIGQLDLVGDEQGVPVARPLEYIQDDALETSVAVTQVLQIEGAILGIRPVAEQLLIDTGQHLLVRAPAEALLRLFGMAEGVDDGSQVSALGREPRGPIIEPIGIGRASVVSDVDGLHGSDDRRVTVRVHPVQPDAPVVEDQAAASEIRRAVDDVAVHLLGRGGNGVAPFFKSH